MKDELEVAELDITGDNSLLNALYTITTFNKNPSTDEEYSENLIKASQVELLLRNTLYYSYYIPREEYAYSDYYRRFHEYREEEIEDNLKLIVELHNQINQEINLYYDEQYGWYAKYFFQVNPNDPVIIDITDKLISNINDQETIKWKLFEFVRDEIEYKYDPNWKTDWVQPPALTLLYGKGDCEDHAVLLASMFMRAGISNVELCMADTNGDGLDDHMFVAVEDTAWDATCKFCDSSAPDDVDTWKQNCFDVNRVITNPADIKGSAELEEGWNECYNSFIYWNDYLSDLGETLSGETLSFEESARRFGTCNKAFSDYVSDMHKCVLFIAENRDDLERQGYQVDSLLNQIISVYDTYSEFLYNWYSALYPYGFSLNCGDDVLGRDTLCHSKCGNSYCTLGSYCVNNQCISA